MATDYLWQRGHQYYLRLAVPRRFRHLFPTKDGKPRAMIAESLGSDYAVAKVKAVQRAGDYLAIFARLRKGEAMTTKQIEAELATDWTAIERRYDEMMRAATEEPMTDAQFAWMKSHPVYRMIERQNAVTFQKGEDGRLVALEVDDATAPQTPKGETISQAAEAWFADMQRDSSAAVKQATLDGHRLRVRAFVEHCGDIPLTDITRAMAAEFLTKVAAGGRSNRTTNNYATTLSGVFKKAIKDGRFAGNNPFDDQKRKAGGASYDPFTVAELQTIFDSFEFEVTPKHTPESALPWVSLIAAYTGMRLEEIAQLKTSDIRDHGANGSTVTAIDIHNGGSNTVKNKSSLRRVPIHSALVRAGFLDYVAALPKDSLLFPGLVRRPSKGGKVGARLSELFRKRLERLGLKRPRLAFHSFRHTVIGALDAAEVSQTDVARIVGHRIKGESFGTYSTGPGLKRLAAKVEEIAYPGLTA